MSNPLGNLWGNKGVITNNHLYTLHSLHSMQGWAAKWQIYVIEKGISKSINPYFPNGI